MAEDRGDDKPGNQLRIAFRSARCRPGPRPGGRYPAVGSNAGAVATREERRLVGGQGLQAQAPLLYFALCFSLFIPPHAQAEIYQVPTPAGNVAVELSHAGPDGSLVTPAAPRNDLFRPPSIFSAPLPSGSGARALGQAGAFTAVADDATAASWNPAGLVQLEYPEASAVFRSSSAANRRSSSDADYTVGDDPFDSSGVNYLSAVYPWHVGERNMVVSLNYQEAYDFTQHFSGQARQTMQENSHDSSSATYEKDQVDHFESSLFHVDINSHLTTHAQSDLSRILQSSLESDIDFTQEGSIAAFTPAYAISLSPKIAIGAALNIYGGSDQGGSPIRSRTTANYHGDARTVSTITDTRTTDGTYSYTCSRVVHDEYLGDFYIPFGSGSGVYPTFSDTTRHEESDALSIEGTYHEENTFEDLEGWNGTLGLLLDPTPDLTIGLTLDLPWTAHARQTKTVQNDYTTYDKQGRVLDVVHETESTSKDVEFRFPLYWALGTLYRWTDRFYTSLDISETLWSDFSFKADDEPRINPLDGSPHGEHAIADCWSVRMGSEYLVMFQRLEIPLRGGLFYEERPALGGPDRYHGFTCGTGLALGKPEQKWICDIAYVYRRGEDVMESLVPGQSGLKTDVTEHQIFLSAIKHF